MRNRMMFSLVGFVVFVVGTACLSTMETTEGQGKVRRVSRQNTVRVKWEYAAFTRNTEPKYWYWETRNEYSVAFDQAAFLKKLKIKLKRGKESVNPVVIVNKIGENGWELISVYKNPIDGSYEMWFKRRK